MATRIGTDLLGQTPIFAQSTPFANPLAVKKAEVSKVFASLHKKLQQKEDRIIASLEKSYLVSGAEAVRYELDKLYVSNSTLQQNMKDPNLAPALGGIQEKIQKDIKRLEKRLNPEVRINWREHECERARESVCEIKLDDSISAYSLKSQPIWSAVKWGTQRNELCNPSCFAVDPSTDNIYVASSGGIIQVYNKEGNHLFQLTNAAHIESICMCFVFGNVYVLGKYNNDFSICKINPEETLKEDLKIISRKRTLETRYHDPGTHVPAIDFNNFPCYTLHFHKNSDYILIFIYQKDDHSILTKGVKSHNLCEPSRKLEIENKLLLKSIHIQNKTTVVCMQARDDTILISIQLFVLYRESPFCIQIFNLRGELVKAIISLEKLEPTCAFYLDYEDNIIICAVKESEFLLSNYGYTNRTYLATSTSCSIYSLSGVLLHTWSYSTDRVTGFAVGGKLSLSVNSNSQLILLNHERTNNMLQLI